MEKFDKDKIQIGSSIEESWFFYYVLYMMYGDYAKGQEIYDLLMKTKSNFLNNAKLYRYLFVEDNRILLDDYLLHTDIPMHLRYYYYKIRQYINENNYTIANELMRRLVAHFEDDNLSSLLEFNMLEPDTIEYLYPECFEEEVSEKEQEKYKEYEQQLVFDIIEKRYDDFAADLKDLYGIYGASFTKYFDLMMLFNHKLTGLEDGSLVNGRYENGISGSYITVINRLLMSNDFYRVCEVVDQLERNSMVYIILHEQCLCALEYIKEKEINEKRNVIINSIDAYGTIEALPLNINGQYDAEMLNNIEPLNKDFEEIETINYFDLYRKAYYNKEYYKALRYLLLFKDKCDQALMAKDIQYLVEELMIKLFNYIKHDPVLEELESRILSCDEKEDYRGVIDSVSEYNLAADIPDPRFTCMACEAAYKMGDYEYALKYYNEVGDKYLSPNDYVVMMECALELYDFSKVIDYGECFNYYEEDSNVKVNYMLSIAYTHLMDFDKAIKMIQKCRDMNNDFFDVPNTYRNEEEIIRKLAEGEEVEMYSLENYYDFCPTSDEMDYETDLFDFDYAFSLDVVKNELKKFNSPEEKLAYMLTVIKILIKNNYDKQRDVLGMCNYAEKFVDASNLTDMQKDLYNFKIKNYKKI